MGFYFPWIKNDVAVSVSSLSVSCMGIKSASRRREGGRSSSTRARSNRAASASNAIVQVNRKLLRNTSPKPSWFFSKDCAGSIHGRTCCNRCCARRLAGGHWPNSVSGCLGRYANCRGQCGASQQRAHSSGSAPTPNQCSPAGARSPTKSTVRPARRRPDAT